MSESKLGPGGESSGPAISLGLASALEGMLSIVSDSSGVAGYHLNGDAADWDEFEEINAANEALRHHVAQRPWVAVSERLPKPGVSVLVYSPSDALYFDHIDEDCDDGDRWYGHDQSYEHYCNVAKPAGSVGPDCEAPYTHWMAIPEPPKEGNE